MISVAGGKLTTWRAIGLRAAMLALADVGRPAPPSDPTPLPGAAQLGVASREISTVWPDLPNDVVMHLARHHGLLAFDVLRHGHNDPVLLERIHPNGPDIWAQAVHARDYEWAATADDVVRGRTTVALRGLDTDDVRRGVERILGGGSGPA
jgi:glycerol-3-phosphate dehydrogenase